MPIYALEHNERNRIEPDPSDPTCYVEFRRITTEKEAMFNAAATKNGLVDQSTKARLMLAWGVVGWAGFGDSHGEIPYRYGYDTEHDDTPELRADKQRDVMRFPTGVQIQIISGMRENLESRRNGIKNSLPSVPPEG